MFNFQIAFVFSKPIFQNSDTVFDAIRHIVFMISRHPLTNVSVFSWSHGEPKKSAVFSQDCRLVFAGAWRRKNCRDVAWNGYLLRVFQSSIVRLLWIFTRGPIRKLMMKQRFSMKRNDACLLIKWTELIYIDRYDKQRKNHDADLSYILENLISSVPLLTRFDVLFSQKMEFCSSKERYSWGCTLKVYTLFRKEH